MQINIIDYRGQDTAFLLRTKKFLEIQQDFVRWQQHGHRFVCWTQHDAGVQEQYPGFDQVISIPRGSAAVSRNRVLEHYAKDEWIGMWDNDATFYWDKLKSAAFPSEANQVIKTATERGYYGIVPFDPRQTPYPEKISADWTFRSSVIFKGTMCFLRVTDVRYDTDMLALEDIDYACQQTVLNRKMARLEQISLKEVAANNSTIFNRTNRLELYSQGKAILSNKYRDLFLETRLGADNKFIIKRLGELQRSLWNNTTIPSLKPRFTSDLFY